MKKILMTTAALAAFAAPLPTSSILHLDHLAIIASAEAANGNGHGNGNGNGGNSSNASNSDRGNSGANGKGNDNSNAGGGSNSGVGNDDQVQVPDTKTQGHTVQNAIAKEKNINAVLGRVNSLGRNINAIIVSKDPHLTAIRTYIINGAELAKAETLADAAQAQYDAALAALSEAGLSGDPADILASLILEYTPDLQSTDPARAQDVAKEIDLVKAVMTAETNLTTANARVAQLSVLTSDAALADALVSMSNRSLSSADISPEILDWSKAVLGVGDATGAIDLWIAKGE